LRLSRDKERTDALSHIPRLYPHHRDHGVYHGDDMITLNEEELTKRYGEGVLAWHFMSRSGRESHGARRRIKTGRTLKATGPLVMCENGMHGSRRLFDALSYAPSDGFVACRVWIGGEIQEGKRKDKLVGRSRTVLRKVDGEKILKVWHETHSYTHADAHADGDAGRELEALFTAAITAAKETK